MATAPDASPPLTTAERRRIYDRERKARQRARYHATKPPAAIRPPGGFKGLSRPDLAIMAEIRREWFRGPDDDDNDDRPPAPSPVRIDGDYVFARDAPHREFLKAILRPLQYQRDSLFFEIRPPSAFPGTRGPAVSWSGSL